MNGIFMTAPTWLDKINVNYVVLFLAILNVIMIFLMLSFITKIKRLKFRMDRLLSGKNNLSIEKDILEIKEDNKFLKEAAERNKKELRYLRKMYKTSFRRVGLVKYDAFNQMGGQLSFSLCLLDDEFDGFILNSVHSSDGCYSYTKIIKAGVCDISLGKEEEEALAIAMRDVVEPEQQ